MRIKALVSQLYEAIGANDEAAMAALMARRSRVAYTPSGDTRTGEPRGGFAGQRVSFPEATVTVDLLMAEETWSPPTSWTGTFQGDTAVFFGTELDIPEAGLTSDWVSTVFFRIECGKVSEVWPVSDRHRQLLHLGVITEEELQSVHAPATPEP